LSAVSEIRNPGTGQLVAQVPAGDPDEAVRRAHGAQREWGRLSYTDRGKLLHACAEAFEAHVDELTPILVAEQGKTIREARIELHKAADTLEHYAGMAREGFRRHAVVRRSILASLGECVARTAHTAAAVQDRIADVPRTHV